MTTSYEFHPHSEIFPMMEDDTAEFAALVDDIKEHGLREPIAIHKGMILDGRNRYRACQKLGTEIDIKEYDGDDLVGFVLSANLHRRHLNEGQRAMVAAKLANLELGANQHSEGTSIDVASRLLNVGRASVDRARRVLSMADPSIIDQVDKGNMSVSAGAQAASLAPKEQQDIADEKKQSKGNKKQSKGNKKQSKRNKKSHKPQPPSPGERHLQKYHHCEQGLIDTLEYWLGDLEDFDKAAEVVERTKKRLDETLNKMKEEADAEKEAA
jgi:ParB-like chromosome segregation protein Spo0J